MLWWLPSVALAGPVAVQPLVLSEEVELRVVPDRRWAVVHAVVLSGAGREEREVLASEAEELAAWLALPRPAPIRLTLCGAVDERLGRAAARRLTVLPPLESLDWTWQVPEPAGPAYREAWRLLDALPSRCALAAAAPSDVLDDLAAWTRAQLEAR